MHHKQVNLPNYNFYYKPVVDPRFVADKGAQFTIGDLHANTMKLISSLVKHDFLRISIDHYKRLACIYNIPFNELTIKDVEEFKTILSKVEVNPAARQALLRLIGDEVADRGEGDLWTLLVMKMLDELGIPWVVCLSNHAFALIYCYEKGEDFGTVDMPDKFCNSILALQKSIDAGFITRNEVDQIIKENYLPHLRIADYSIFDGNHLAHYIHAPCGDNIIIAMAEQMGVEYGNSTPELEAASLNKMQEVFEEKYVNQDAISTLIFPRGVEYFKNEDKYSPVHQSMWKRKKNNLVRNPDKKYINGHSLVNEGEVVPANVVELDNMLGKCSLQQSYDDEDDYIFFYTHDTQGFVNEFSDEVKGIKFNNQVMKFFGFENKFKLILKDKIYSRMQIKCLQEFIGNVDSISIWNELIGRNDNLRCQFIHKLQDNYELWDVLFILEKNNLLNAGSFEAILGNSHNSEIIYQLLLLMERLGKLKNIEDIECILRLNHKVKYLYEHLIEMMQYQQEIISFEGDFSVLEKGMKFLVPYTMRLKALNTLFITYDQSWTCFSDETISLFIRQDTGEKNLIELYEKLVNFINYDSDDDNEYTSSEEDEEDSFEIAGKDQSKKDNADFNRAMEEISSLKNSSEIHQYLTEMIEFFKKPDKQRYQAVFYRLLKSCDAVIVLTTIWSLSSSNFQMGKFLYALLEHYEVDNFVKIIKMRIDFCGDIDLVRAIKLAEIDKEKFYSVLHLLDDLKYKNILNEKFYMFITSRLDKVDDLITFFSVFKNKLSGDVMDVLISNIQFVDRNFTFTIHKYVKDGDDDFLFLGEVQKYFRNLKINIGLNKWYTLFSAGEAKEVKDNVEVKEVEDNTQSQGLDFSSGK